MKMNKGIVAVVFVLCLAFNSQGATEVSGNVYGGTWTVAGSPYILTADVTVPDGYTLTIEPGVHVLGRTSACRLEIEGILIAVGTEESPIVFDKESSSWEGLYFDYAETGTILKHCVIRNVSTGYGTQIRYSHIQLHDCVIEKHTGSVCSLYIHVSSPQIFRCKLINNSTTALRVSGSSNPTIRNTLIANNVDDWTSAVHSDSIVHLVNCTIANNQIGSTYSDSGVFGARSGSTLRNCVISGNKNGSGPCSIDKRLELGYPDIYDSIMDADYSVSSEHNVIHVSAQFKNPTMQAGGIIFEPGTINGLPVDYSLQASSMGVNHGNNAMVMTGEPDLMGQNRIYDGSVDAGCFEYIPVYTNGVTVGMEKAFHITCPSEAGRKYTFWYTEDLAEDEWFVLDDVVTGTGLLIGVFDSAENASQRFYRVTDSAD